ncbi:MAG: hypothetical protein ACPG8W_14750 [Candidatus Promineifilaceae bacterium]
MQELLNLGPLNLVYFGILGISFIFALISLIGSEIGDALNFDADVDGGGDGVDFANVSPFSIAMFGAAFGLTGLVTRIVYEMPAINSVFWSAMIGLVIASGAQALLIYVLMPTTTSHVKLADDAIGRTVDVIISIPNKGKGTIAYDNKGGRVTLAAITNAGHQIQSGEAVIIEKIVGRVAHVRRISTE